MWHLDNSRHLMVLSQPFPKLSLLCQATLLDLKDKMHNKDNTRRKEAFISLEHLKMCESSQVLSALNKWCHSSFIGTYETPWNPRRFQPILKFSRMSYTKFMYKISNSLEYPTLFPCLATLFKDVWTSLESSTLIN